MELNNQKLKEFEAVENYEDPEGLTTKKLRWGLWYVENLKNFRKLGIIFLSLISVILWTYTIYNFAMYIGKGMKDDELLIRQIKDSGINQAAVWAGAPRNLEVGQASVLNANGKMDFFARINNPNQWHAGTFNYYFISGNGVSERHSGFILPGETKYVLALSEELPFSYVSDVKIENLNWTRIDKHKISDWQDFKAKRIDFAATDIKFSSDRNSGLSEKMNMNRLEFDVRNNTAFNYWNSDFIILLYSGPNVVSVNKYSLDEFMSGKKSHIEMVWPGNLPPVSQVLIEPEINILKNDIYIKYEGVVEEK